MVKSKSKWQKLLFEYLILTVATLPMIIGVYVFKFPNNFTFAGVTGISVVVSKVLEPVIYLSPSTYNLIMNCILLVLAFLLIGRSFGVKTVYVTLLSSLGMSAMDKLFPNLASLSGSPEVDLIFAIILPAVSTAILFNFGASAGGTEIVAMIVKKYSSANIGTALLIVDSFVTLSSYFVFGWPTGLFSTVGLLAKSLVINNVIESINLCKFFTIVCDAPEPICEFIDKELKRSSTIYDATGSHTHNKKTVILTVMNRAEAVKLRNFIKVQEPGAFMMITNSSEIIGRDFRVYN